MIETLNWERGAVFKCLSDDRLHSYPDKNFSKDSGDMHAVIVAVSVWTIMQHQFEISSLFFSLLTPISHSNSLSLRKRGTSEVHQFYLLRK